MRVVQCFNPKVITNRYTGEQVTVPCGDCPACRNSRAALWVQKLDQEMHCHKYTLFVTLQYDEQNVNQVVRLRKEDTPFIDGKSDWSYIDSETGQLFSFYDKSIKRHSKADRQYVFDSKVLNVLSKRDCQLFIKRLRYYAFEITKQNNQIRYFLTGEYGGRSFRPHVHALLFFDSEVLALHIEEMLGKSWKYGNIYDPHFVNGSASEYVASYVNSFSKLPSIYHHAGLRQFSLFSKSPAIGTVQFLPERLKEIFFKRLDKIRLFQASSNQFLDVPLWRSLRDRCFPRVQQFTRLSLSDRVTLYGFGNRFLSAENSEIFARWLKIFFADRYLRGDRKDWLGKYFCDISYISTYNKILQCYERRYSKTSLVNFARIVRRVCVTASAYGLSINDYVTNISKFYDECEKSHYKQYLKFQDDYFKRHPNESHALFFDYAFIERVNGKHVSELTKTDKFYLESNMLIDSDTDIVNISLDDCFDYRDLKSLHTIIENGNTKTKEMNDYILSKGNKFQNIINYFNNLNSEDYERNAYG